MDHPEFDLFPLPPQPWTSDHVTHERYLGHMYRDSVTRLMTLMNRPGGPPAKTLDVLLAMLPFIKAANQMSKQFDSELQSIEDCLRKYDA